MDMNNIRGTIDRLEYAIMALKGLGGRGRIHEMDLMVAIKALEKQAFFENEVSNIHSWFVDNKDCLLDSARSISENWWDDCNIDGKIDKVDLDFMVEDLVDEIQKGILNVLDTYRGSFK